MNACSLEVKEVLQNMFESNFTTETMTQLEQWGALAPLLLAL
jgi:hypothetical protein